MKKERGIEVSGSGEKDMQFASGGYMAVFGVESFGFTKPIQVGEKLEQHQLLLLVGAHLLYIFSLFPFYNAIF